MRSPTSLHESRVYSPENFWSPVQKDFCNNICQKRTHAVQQRTIFTRSARLRGASRPAGTSWSIAFAACKLITSSNRVGCSTGMSAGFAPCNILTTICALWRKSKVWRGPYAAKPPASAISGHWYIAGRRSAVIRSMMRRRFVDNSDEARTLTAWALDVFAASVADAMSSDRATPKTKSSHDAFVLPPATL